MLQSIVREIGVLAFGSNCLLFMWFGMRDWRRFFLKEPSRPMPTWVNRLTLYLWLAAIPWAIESLGQSVNDFLRDHSQTTKAAWFALGFLAFCVLLSLVARYLPSAKMAHLANQESGSTKSSL